MEITEVRIKLMEESSERLKAFCSITLDNCFVVRDLKIIEGSSGPFVAMPSRKMTCHCSHCGMKNHLRANHCNQCGGKIANDRFPTDSDGRAKLYADIAHPINSGCREMIQEAVIHDYQKELERAKQPDYVSRYDEFDFEDAPRPTAPSTPAPAMPAKQGIETRVDRPHDQSGAHAPRSGGSAQSDTHLPSSMPPTPTASQEEGFGAGIFVE